MGVVRTQEDAWTKEMRKWESRPVLVNGTYIEPLPVDQGGKFGAPFAEYPKMLYQAESAMGGPRITETFVVADEQQEANMRSRGWFASQEAALNGVEAAQFAAAQADAERQHQERWMGGKARAEAAAVDESTMAHVPSIPETPIKPRGKSA